LSEETREFLRVTEEDEKANLRLEYELMRKGMLERNNRMYLADSIVISVSFLIILGCFQPEADLFPIGIALFLFIFFMLSCLLYLHCSTLIVNDIERKTMNEIIEKFRRKGFVTEKMHKEQLEGKPWFEMRKWIWPGVILFFMVVDVVALIAFLKVNILG